MTTTQTFVWRRNAAGVRMDTRCSAALLKYRVRQVSEVPRGKRR